MMNPQWIMVILIILQVVLFYAAMYDFHSIKLRTIKFAVDSDIPESALIVTADLETEYAHATGNDRLSVAISKATGNHCALNTYYLIMNCYVHSSRARKVIDDMMVHYIVTGKEPSPTQALLRYWGIWPIIA